MNTRRKINNIVPKEGFENMYDVYYSMNKDKRGNYQCVEHVESIIYKDGKLQFNPRSTKFMNGLQLMASHLKCSQKEIEKEIYKRLEYIN
jgi:hypothetical protein